MRSHIAIVIPVFNENLYLHSLLSAVKKYSKNPIILVDDGSLVPISIRGCTILRHQINLGKGSAMLTGANYAFSQLHSNAVIFMDGDGQHDPKYLPQFEENLLFGYDVVFGSRTHTSGMPLIRYLGNKFASVYLNLLFGAYVSDVLSGYRAITFRAFKLLRWNSPRYGVETEMVARLGKYKNKLKFTEIPISTIYIDKYKGVNMLDAVKILINSIWWKLY